MVNHEGIKSRHFNRYVENHTDSNNYPPEFYKIPVKLPMDIAIVVLKRFEEENYLWQVDRTTVTLGDIIAHLCWAWGSKHDLDIKGNIFENFFPNLVKPKKKKAIKKVKPPKNPLERRGRKPKIQVSLFNTKLEHTNPGEAAAEK